MTISPNKWELDVQGYLNTCNISAATPRKQIRDFSAGVNDLGLWNSMVCWPLRSSQNYGSGDTVFSLGGLGTYNGTRVNGPTWGADGITLLGSSSQYINTNYNFTNDNNFVFAVGRFTSGSFGDLITAKDQFAVVLRNDSGGIVSVFNPTFSTIFSGVIPINTFTSLAVRKPTGSPATAWRNGSLVGTSGSSSAYNSSTEAVLLGCRNLSSPSIFLTGAIPFAMICTSPASASDIHTLYSTTLGQGITFA